MIQLFYYSQNTNEKTFKNVEILFKSTWIYELCFLEALNKKKRIRAGYVLDLLLEGLLEMFT